MPKLEKKTLVIGGAAAVLTVIIVTAVITTLAVKHNNNLDDEEKGINLEEEGIDLQLLSRNAIGEIVEGGAILSAVHRQPYEQGDLLPSTSLDSLSMLWLVQEEEDDDAIKTSNKIAPIARSYDGNKWEKYSFLSSSNSNVQVDCDDTSSSSCTISNLPSEPRPSSHYEIHTVSYTTPLPQQDVAARFLEQATFGPTVEEIMTMVQGQIAPSKWLINQMNSSIVPISSHREFARRHLNHRLEAPNSEAIPTHPCQAGTRYRRVALSEKDLESNLEITTDPKTNRKVFKIHNQARTVLQHRELYAGDTGTRPRAFPDGFYTLQNCAKDLYRQAKRKDPTKDPTFYLYLYHPDIGECRKVVTSSREAVPLFPMVYFDEDTPPTNPDAILDLNDDVQVIAEDFYSYTGSELTRAQPAMSLLLKSDVEDPSCEDANIIPATTGMPSQYIVLGRFQGNLYMHDPRWSLLENTVQSPAIDGGGSRVVEVEAITQQFRSTQCSNAPRNFINEESCYYNIENPNDVCSFTVENDDDGNDEGVPVELTMSNIERVFQVSSDANDPRYIYVVKGLRQKDEIVPYNPPCTPSTPSRWMPVANNENDECGAAGEVIGTRTTRIFRRLIRRSQDENPLMKDIFFPATGVECNAEDMNRFGFAIVGRDGQCWKNVHQDEGTVFDFTTWVNAHPGGAPAIRQFAMDETFTLLFPESHEMSRWYENGARFRKSIGRLGDVVRVRLPDAVVDLVTGITRSFDSNNNNGNPNGQTSNGLACGSPNEVANDSNLHGSFDARTQLNRTTDLSELDRQKLSTWMAISLNAPDQLRQKVAWVLSQLLVVTPSEIDDSGGMTELFVNYYDIFVRHAFGNYRDILKEVSYSPIMGEMLSYMNSRSTNLVWKSKNTIEYPDENYAREIMQLFTIGLYELNNDGTYVVDDHIAMTSTEVGVSDNRIPTYTNDDIIEYARLWTGFQRQHQRGNIEKLKTNRKAASSSNTIDPMRVNLVARDSLPKMGLKQKYIGDGLPLCSDLPHQHFLKRGATYRLLGSTSTPLLLSEPTEWATNSAVTRLRLDTRSELYQKLCSGPPSRPSSCQWVAKVVLDEDLACTGLECDIESPRVLEVANGIYYEYSRMACAQLSFFDNGIGMRNTKNKRNIYCENPILPEGGLVSCCASSDAGNGAEFEDEDDNTAQSFQLFSGERLTYAVAERRCADQGLQVCLKPPTDCLETDSCDSSVGFWTRFPCQVQAKIDLEGNVAIVHKVTSDRIDNKRLIHWNVKEDTKTSFRVLWQGPIRDMLSEYETYCAALGCTRDESDNLCVCPTTTNDEAVFSSTPTRQEVLEFLSFGAFSPKLYNQELVEKSDLGNGVWMYSPYGQPFSSESVFEVVDDNNMKQYRKNLRSVVRVGTNDALPLSFRNPPHIISLTNPELRDAQYETDAGLDQYFYHPNTAPFLAIRFAQRFGISNPSPRYVDVMATAFRSGIYEDSDSGMKVGSGNYGDLMALVAAALLDREARSAVLDADPTHGSILEPFLKLLRLMRSLEFKPDEDKPFVEFAVNLQEQIGQEPHQMPSVFSFFAPNYRPPGPLFEENLFCPECQVLTGPKMVALLNGIFSLLKYGLDSAYGGFGVGRSGQKRESRRSLGTYSFATGFNTYLPSRSASAGQVVDDLATLLTSGRLEARKREFLKTLYERALGRGYSATKALIHTQQLIASTPEFHSNARSANNEGARERIKNAEPSNTPYKAVIYLMLEGGYDSFNMLVPHQCQERNQDGMTVAEQYVSERGEIAFNDNERVLRINAMNQPCDIFALHDELTVFKELYEKGELSFVANAGVIGNVDGMTKSNYRESTPIRLFAHNAMQQETKTVDPFSQAAGSGFLGRLAEVLTKKGYKTNSIAVDDPSIAVVSTAGSDMPDPLILSRFKIQAFNPTPDNEIDLNDYIKELNAATSDDSSVFGEIWSKQLSTGLQEADFLKASLESASLSSVWPEEGIKLPEVIQRFSAVSKAIQTHDRRGTDRDLFYTSFSGWDHHSSVKEKLRSRFADLNEALRLLVHELKEQNVWDDVAIIVASEFGRTITPNSGGGSDHAWGGHYVLIGGGLNGGKIWGKYPNDITPASPLNLGRGRILPTTSWDAILNGVSEWMGAELESELDHCLPNRHQTTGGGFTELFSGEDLFLNFDTTKRSRHLR